MAKRTVITTRQEIEGSEKELNSQPTAQEGEDQEINADAEELAQFLLNIGGSANKIKIWKVLPDGTKQYCGSAEPSVVSEDYIAQTYGGGRYLIHATYQGRFVKGGARDISIYQPPNIPSSIQTKSDDSANPLIVMMQAEIARTNTLLLELIRNKQSDQPTLIDIVSVVKEMQLMNKPPDVMGVLPSIMNVFKETMSLARQTAGGDSKTDWVDLIGKAMDKLPLIVGQIASARKPGEPINGQGDDMNIEKALKQGIVWLKAKARLGKDADLQVAFILDNFDDPNFYELGKTLLNMPFDDFGKYDPEIMQEPLRSWFERVYNGLKEELQDDSQNTVAAGDLGLQSNPAGNEKVND